MDFKPSYIFITNASDTWFFKGPGWYLIDEVFDIIGPFDSKEEAAEAYAIMKGKAANV